MSYEAWGEPDDADLGERATDAGYLDPDTVEKLRDLLKEVSFETRPGNRSDAALVMIDNILNPPDQKIVPDTVFFRVDPPDDPHVVWAKALLKDIL